jgi:hypothetical protein
VWLEIGWVFELQLAAGVTAEAGLAAAAGLREALAFNGYATFVPTDSLLTNSAFHPANLGSAASPFRADPRRMDS